MGVIANNANSGDSNIIFPELSYKIIGAAFTVFNELGWGFSEKHYQRVLSKEFDRLNVAYKEEVFIPFTYKSSRAINYFADFVVEDKILLELKVVNKLGYTHVRQVLDYLKTAHIKLGILLYFTSDGVKYRRVLNSSI